VTPLGPIIAGEEAAAESPLPRPRLPLDPLMALAVAGLGVCSILTLKTATRTLIPGDPNYYVERQGIYLGVGVVLMRSCRGSTIPTFAGRATRSTARSSSASSW